MRLANFRPAVVLPTILLLIAGCRATPPSNAGSVRLFNGRNFDGWTFCMLNDADPMQTWSVTHGVIHCTGQPHGYMRTTKAYDNYMLTVVWRFLRVAPHADNSGVFVNIQGPDKVWPTCVECQGQFQHQGDIYLQAGAGADGYPAGKNAVLIRQNGPPNEKPAGQWDTDRIICKGGDIQLFVNGKLMNHITGCTLTSGYIGIQSEGGDIEVREINLKPLE